MYLDMIIDEAIGDKDIIQTVGYETNTVQSYSTIDRVKTFVNSVADMVDIRVISWENSDGKVYNRRAHIICKKKVV